jgi:hypothetical protein
MVIDGRMSRDGGNSMGKDQEGGRKGRRGMDV